MLLLCINSDMISSDMLGDLATNCGMLQPGKDCLQNATYILTAASTGQLHVFHTSII